MSATLVHDNILKTMNCVCPVHILSTQGKTAKPTLNTLYVSLYDDVDRLIVQIFFVIYYLQYFKVEMWTQQHMALCLLCGTSMGNTFKQQLRD